MREPQNEEGDRPLSGVRVLDLADEKGELAGRLLADLGASVVRVEPPEGGRSRGLPPFKDGCSLYFATRNSNKLGLAPKVKWLLLFITSSFGGKEGGLGVKDA